MCEMTQPGRMLNQARSTTTAPPRNRHVPCLLSTSLSFVTWLAVGRAAFAQAGFPAANDDETSSAAVAPVAGVGATEAAVAGAPREADALKPEAATASPQPKRRANTTQLGLSPQTTAVASPSNGPPALPEAPTSTWGFRFHGFFRGPMRLSMDSESGHGIQFHAPPVTPDSNYTTWSFTNNNPGPWGEMLFQYGNNRVTMTMAIASYNIKSGGWRELQDQLGIDRAFVTLNFPDALGDVGMMVWNVGVFGDHYGAMGKYDGGAYDTYLIGRTRIAGATGTFNFDLADNFRLVAEGGGGAKMDVQQWTQSPYPSWQPFPGHAQMGTTMLAHGHVGGVFAQVLTLTGHCMFTWTMDAMRTDLNDPTSAQKPTDYASPGLSYAAKDGRMRILGVDLRLDGGWLGDGYLGFSSIKTANVGVLSDTIEVLHSQGGWQYQANYTGANYAGGIISSHGYSTVNSVGFQYTFSLAAFLLRPQEWWGQGADFTIQVFGMYNRIGGLAPRDEPAMALMGKSKLKLGTQWLYAPLTFMSGGVRFDSVQPNMGDRTHDFWVVSPRLIFHTAFVTREQVMIQYQYYGYGSWYFKNTDSTLGPWPGMPYPYGQPGALWNPIQPDKHTFTIAASMWW